MKEPRLSPGDIVRHFKRELVPQGSKEYLYRILEFARHSETGEPYVVYESLYGEGDVYLRPFDMFMSEVDRNKYPGIRQRWRFEKAGPDEIALVTDGAAAK